MSDEKECPLFPALSEAAEQEAQQLIDGFKKRMKEVCEETLSALYTDVSMYIESDHWSNYRNKLMDGFRDYGNAKVQGAHDFKTIRQAILKEHRADIINDLNQDMVAEIEELKQTIEIINRNNQRH